ncbi:efflux RND transporter periplasmic adaptor subunit [Simiduia agarivorans]|uniref:Cation efflux system protein n=1 Tax=Simiduia agarivorans (strain DSM 21679 / JCM 13881 / BCRC 17597 / SA1) TaxID=1117647 RepID=K4KQF9_SIMAS|nr:efflux RND transporter periplasmic adaptor subunit [Simiduia agarivorans]AFV00354.1 cation efflux system protein [Simiduia agarivorans SA1 = DSM 21679]
MKILFSALAGALLTLAAVHYWPAGDSGGESEAKPLYWVAPMDPNFRRPGPGKSPMGMDLIPVYEEAEETEPGLIRINPEVQNNLGVRTELARERALDPHIRTVGYVGYNQDTLVHLHPRVEGWIEKLYVKAEGDPVTAGQPLYDLYSPELVNAQEDLMLALRRGEERLVEGAKGRLRALKLADKTINQLVDTRKVMQTVTYFAPQSGVVEALAIREGFYVQPGSTLFSIGALDSVWVEADVFAAQAHLVRAGLPVVARFKHLPGKSVEGRVSYVYPTLDADTRTLRLRVVLDNAGKLLKPNMFAELTIAGDAGKPALTVPRAAVIRTGSQDRVVLDRGDGRFKSVAVHLGRSDKDYVEILHGLKAGDPVVVSAQFLLDSESSRESDFLRMTPPLAKNEAEVNGVVNSVDAANRTANISREAIDKWNRPAATMDFAIDQAVSLDAFVPGAEIRFKFRAENGEFTILTVTPAKKTPAANPHAHH